MKRLYQFIKSTILGGVIFLVPLVVLAVVLGKAYGLMIKVAKPLSARIPLDAIGGVALANILAVLAILLCCLFAGIIAKGNTAKRVLKSVESKLLVAIPGYTKIHNNTRLRQSGAEH